MTEQRIMVVEDERDMAELVSLRLKREGYAVETCHDGVTAREEIRRRPPDLVLLDIMLPRMSGTELLRELRSDPRGANIPVIMLTAKGEEGDVVVGLEFGADDYVAKPFSMSVLVARIAAVLRRSGGQGEDGENVLAAGEIRIDRGRHRVEVGGERISLTLTEFRLLAGLVAARGRVLTRDQLINKAMGVDAVVTDRTIDVHLTALRRKLGIARKYIETVRGVGYRLAVDDDETT